MWETKLFKTYQACKNFIVKYGHDYQINVIYLNNGYGVEYKKLRKVY